MKYLIAIILCGVSSASGALVEKWELQDDAASATVVASVDSPTNDGTLSEDNSDDRSTTGPGTVLTKSFNFAGTNAYVAVGAVTGAPAGNSARTICFWMSAASFDTGINNPIMGYAFHASTAGVRLSILAEDNAVSVSFNSHRIKSTTTALSTDTWYHVAVVVPSGSTTTADVDIYINGTLQSLTNESGSSQTLNTATPDIQIGQDPIARYSGKIADVRVYNSDESANLSAIMAEADGGGGVAVDPLSKTITGSPTAINPIPPGF